MLSCASIKFSPNPTKSKSSSEKACPVSNKPFSLKSIPWLLAIFNTEKFIFFNTAALRSEEHTSELQSRFDLVCRLLLEKKKTKLSKRSDSAQLIQID